MFHAAIDLPTRSTFAKRFCAELVRMLAQMGQRQ